MKLKILIFLILFLSCSNNYEYNPDCWKTARETCNEENRINSGNMRNGNIGGTGN